MQCPPPGSQLAAAARRAAQASHGVNPDHRCDVARCRFVVSPDRLLWNGRPARVAVCKTGLHIHWCGTGVCELAATEARTTDGPWVCPVSNLEVTGQAEVYCPQRVRGRGSRPDTFSHSMTPVRRRSSTKKSRRSETRRYVATLLASAESEALLLASANRRERLVAAAVARAGNTFMAQMLNARNASPRGALPPVSAEILSALAASIDEFLDRIRHRLRVCKGNASQVAAVVGFLAVGMQSDGVVLFPHVPWIAQRLPAAADLGKLTGFQCRPVSISARHIKAAVFGAHGKPIASLLFRLPPAIFTSGYRHGIRPRASCASDASAVCDSGRVSAST